MAACPPIAAQKQTSREAHCAGRIGIGDFERSSCSGQERAKDTARIFSQNQTSRARRIRSTSSRLEFVYNFKGRPPPVSGRPVCTCRRRPEDFSRVAQGSLLAIVLSVPTRSQARPARSPVRLEKGQQVCLVHG
jgi:hypothetical protein